MAFSRKRDTWKTENIDVKRWSVVQRDPWKIIILYVNAWKYNLLLSVKTNRFLHTFLGKTRWSSTSDRNCMSFREWSVAKRAKRNKNFYHEWKITRAFPTTHVSTYIFLVRKAQISVESYFVYQSVSQKSILCDVYFIMLNFMILIW
jgi:hypothetical protein